MNILERMKLERKIMWAILLGALALNMIWQVLFSDFVLSEDVAVSPAKVHETR